MRIMLWMLAAANLIYGLFLLEINRRFDAANLLFLLLFALLAAGAIYYMPVKNYLTKEKRALYIIGTVLILSMFAIAIMEYKMHQAANTKLPDDIEAVIVLGAGLKDGEVSLALKERLDIAYDYAENRKNAVIVVSGGVGFAEERSEAAVMKEYLIDKGMEENRILLENKATSTYENLLFSKEILKEKKKIAVVTNDFHLFRSLMIAKRLGYEAYGIPAQTPAVILVQTHVREYMAIIKSIIMDK